MLTDGACTYAGWGALPAAVRGMAQAAYVPGFSSVMLDASMLPLDENKRLTRAAVDLAHAVGATVGGGLGRIGGQEAGTAISQTRLRPASC